MKRIANILAFCLLSLLLVSCGGNGRRGLFTPASSGRPYEALVVIDKNMWERPAGRAIYDVLDTDVPGLPQAERSFRISNVDPDHFDRVLKIFRNILVVDIQDIYTQPKFRYSRDVYASPQMIMTIQAPDETSLAEYVTKNKQVIIDFFTRAEMNRQIALLKKKHSSLVSTRLGTQFDCDIWAPVELDKYKVGQDFFWASTNRATADMNLVVYSYPYTDTMFVDVKDIVVKGEYAMEARGLWQMQGDMMGGPFVAHARVDRANGRVVVAEAFIYSPDKLKRNLMRQMEAVLYTLRLPNESIIDEVVISPEGVEENKR
jgi:hypothetical protein